MDFGHYHSCSRKKNFSGENVGVKNKDDVEIVMLIIFTIFNYGLRLLLTKTVNSRLSNMSVRFLYDMFGAKELSDLMS